MATRKEYIYQIKGNKLSLLELDFSTSDGLNLSGVTVGQQYGTSGDGLTDDIPSGSTIYKSPLETVSSGLEIEYATYESIESDSDDIPVASYLQKALVYYVKARLAEDILDLEQKEYFMREFRKMVEKHENAKVAGPRIIMSGNMAIR